jgi:isocitrate lyase
VHHIRICHENVGRAAVDAETLLPGSVTVENLNSQAMQGPEFAAREKGYTFVSHQQEVGAGYFDDVTTVIQGGSSSVKALTGSTEEEQFH